MATSTLVYNQARKPQPFVVLTVSTKEAEYLRALRALLQNPPCKLEDEPELDQECRSAIWSELNNCLEAM